MSASIQNCQWAEKSFAYRGAHLWNNLESKVKKAPSLSLFKHWYLSFPILFFYYLSCIIRIFTFTVYIYIAF